MAPALILVGVGSRHSLWLPLPVFLLWPFWLLGWALWAAMRGLHLPGRRRLWLALSLSGQLSGLRLDVRSREGFRIRVRMI